MSYLDLPRIHFGGQFQASPSTFNNTPNNYDPRRWSRGPDPDDPTDEIELYWSPQGNGVFDLVECAVTAVVPAEGSTDREPLEGQPVSAVHNPVPPKLVDLDPMQQNVSEVWGLEIQIGDVGGAWVRGSYVAGPFSSIWQNSQGNDTPRNSQSGGAAYQSTLVDLMWSNPEGPRHSPVLAALRRAAQEGVSDEYPEPRLSIRMVVNSHNNKPPTFLFSDATFSLMGDRGVPSELVAKLADLAGWVQMLPKKKPYPSPLPGAGLIPTEAYVNLLLEQKLGPQQAKRWGQTILDATRQPYVTEPYMSFDPPQPYDTVIPTPFNYGLISGTVGAVGKPEAGEPPEPVYAVPARTLAPPREQVEKQATTCFFTPVKLHKKALTIDLGNSLPVELPGRIPWNEKLGKLTLRCGSSFSHTIDYEGDLLARFSGVLDIPIGRATHRTLAANPLRLVGTPGGTETTLLAENGEGLSLRADKFVFRMNPARESTGGGYVVREDGSLGAFAGRPLPIEYPRGKSGTVHLHVRKFGRVAGTEGVEIGLHLLDPKEAMNYTLKTAGTSGTKGVTPKNISVPPGAVDWWTNTADRRTVTVGADGIAKFTITVADPGNPRTHVDGQVYFITYGPNDVADYVGDPDDLVSLHVFQHTMSRNDRGRPENTTWENGIGRILTQYGRLYPVMSVFGLSSYELVKQNHVQIRRVLEIDFEQALHMPVTRDLSASRRQLILDWMDKGMPRV